MKTMRLKDWVLETYPETGKAYYFVSRTAARNKALELIKAAALGGVEEFDQVECSNWREIWSGNRMKNGQIVATFGVSVRQLGGEDVIRRYPRITGHLICESLGYASPLAAGNIILNAARGEQNYCEWIDACYQCNPQKPLQDSIRGRHGHRGYMAEYRRAQAIIGRVLAGGPQPAFASWF